VSLSRIGQTLLVCGFWVVREEPQSADTMGYCREKYKNGQNDFSAEPEILTMEKFAEDF
jgi:hypothetical protein